MIVQPLEIVQEQGYPLMYFTSVESKWCGMGLEARKEYREGRRELPPFPVKRVEAQNLIRPTSCIDLPPTVTPVILDTAPGAPIALFGCPKLAWLMTLVACALISNTPSRQNGKSFARARLNWLSPGQYRLFREELP